MSEQIEELELQLAEMPKKKLYFIYGGIIVLLVFLSWNLYGQNLSQEIDSKQSSVDTLENKIKKSSIRSYNIAIKNAKNEILSLNDEIDKLKAQERFINSELKSIDFIFFDQKGVANILDNILKQSVKKSIDIDTIEYSDKNSLYEPHIYEKENIQIKGEASYKNILYLINKVDNINALLKIQEINIYVDENQTTNFDLNVSYFGVEI
jgi:Tfp pilus assembly protein PilO